MIKTCKDLFALVFPKRCVVCNKMMIDGESVICVECRTQMPITHYWTIKENYLTDLFAARVLLNEASALFYYQHNSQWRDMIHDMKYNSAHQVADILGQIYGFYIKQSPLYKDIEVIVPIPLHRKRLIRRGYNQSEIFAFGIAKQIGAKVVTNAVRRVKNTPKQALKADSQQRWENVENAFELTKPNILQNKKIMIVDDVITTGATIEACTRAIEKKLPNTRFYIGAMACIKKGLK